MQSHWRTGIQNKNLVGKGTVQCITKFQSLMWEVNVIGRIMASHGCPHPNPPNLLILLPYIAGETVQM